MAGWLTAPFFTQTCGSTFLHDSSKENRKWVLNGMVAAYCLGLPHLSGKMKKQTFTTSVCMYSKPNLACHNITKMRF